MRHAARPAVIAFVLLAGLAGALVPASCAHTNSPGGFLQCMENAKDEAAAQQLIYAMIDKDATAALEAALVAVPDAVRCLLQRAASVVGAGPQENERARKAKAFLDSHGLSSTFKGGGVTSPATGVGSLPNESQGAKAARPGAPGTDGSGAITSRWSLPFEDSGLVVAVRTPGGNHYPCERGTRSYAWPPYAADTVCVATDPTVNIDKGLAMVGETLTMLSKPVDTSKASRSPLWHTRTRRPSGIGPGSGGGTWGG